MKHLTKIQSKTSVLARWANSYWLCSFMLCLCSFNLQSAQSSAQTVGTTYYVSSSQGNDNNSGASSGQAWRSLSKVESAPLQPGDKVLLRRGDTWGERLFLDNIQGTASARIVIGVYGLDDAPLPVLNPSSPDRVVRLENSHYITVENLNIRVPQDKSGILIKGDSRYCTVRNCLVTSSKGNIGIVYSSYLKEADARPTYSVVSNCEVSGFREGIVGNGGINKGGRIENNYVHSARTDVAGDLIRAHGSREKKGDYNGLVITGNKLTQWTDDAVDLYTGSDVIVEYNEIYRGEYPLFNNGTNNGSGNGIKLGGVTNPSSPAPTSSGNIARYNVIYNLSPRKKLSGGRNFLSNGIDTNGGVDSKIYGNLIYDVDGNAIVAGDGTKVYNNTCVTDTKETLYVNGSDVQIYNNIFSSGVKEISVKAGATATGSNNLLVNNDFDTAYNGTNDLNGNPGFVNPGANNHKLTAGSIAVDAGTSFGQYNQDREGNPIIGTVDVGSYEFQSGVVNPPVASTPLWLEAECASSVGQGWQMVTDSEASGGKYLVYPSSGRSLESAPTNPSDQVVFSVNLTNSGTYHLQARIRAPSGTSDSFWFRVDNGQWIKWWQGITRGTQFAWNTATNSPFTLTAGTHTITVAYREGGTQLDKLLLSTEETLPEGTGPQASNCTSLPPASENGVAYRYYQDQTENWSALPDFESLAPEKEGVLANFSLSPAEQADHYGLVYTTYLEVEQAGEYTFYLLSDDGSQLLIEGQQIVSYDGRHSATEEQSGKVVLSKGRHRLEVRYFEYRFSQSLLVSYAGPGVSKQVIPDEVLFLEDDAPVLPTEMIVDNRDAGFSTVGDWSTGNYQKNNRYGADYRHDGNTDKGSKTATFTASVAPGNYEVYAWWTADKNRASNVPVQISYACGVASTMINQQANGGSWQLLGSYYFEEEASVTLSNAGTDGHVLADAVRFLSSGSDEPCQEPSTSTSVWLEAECASSIGQAWQVVSDSEASGGSYLQVQPGNSSIGAAPTDASKQLTFTFSVSQAGEYTLYSRQRENGSNNDDSFWVRTNAGSWVKNGLNTPAGSFAWGAARDADNNYSQVTFSLVAGSNTLTLGTREDNLQLDKLYLTLDGQVPSGKGSTDSNCSSSARRASWAKSGKAGLESESDKLQVYPNPADGQLRIAVGSVQEPVQVVLTDLSGRVVYRGEVTPKTELEVSTAVLPEGFYLLRLEQTHNVFTKKVIVQH